MRIRKESDSLILTPVRRHTLREHLDTWAPMDGSLPKPDDLPHQATGSAMRAAWSCVLDANQELQGPSPRPGASGRADVGQLHEKRQPLIGRRAG